VNSNLAVVFSVSASGTEVMVVSGGSLTVHVRVAGVES
jgi:hypothetical protein